MRTARRSIAVGLLALVLGAGCGSDHYRPDPAPPTTPGNDGGTRADGAVDSARTPDGLPSDPRGPTIAIVAPISNVKIVGTTYRFIAQITDKDGVDPTSVTLSFAGQTTSTAMTASTTQTDRYEALVDVSSFSRTVSFWITARDVLGYANTKVSSFYRDPGPTVTFLVPTTNGHYKGGLTVKVLVEDILDVPTFKVELGDQSLTLQKSSLATYKWLYSATVSFDKGFTPALTGKQVLVATATNANKATVTVQRVFYVDNEGPAITIKSHKAGEILGGTVTLQASVKDDAGVLASSVKCVIGSGTGTMTVALKATTTSDVYEGQFDSRVFPTDQIWPVMSFRAADTLGNESHEDIQVGLDNGQPIIELDPATQVFVGRYKNGVLQCSHPILDAVGDDAANDDELVPQVVPLRARVEDQGNHVPSAKFVPIAEVDSGAVWLYVLDDTSKALVVDTTGDGYCDGVNPEVMPLSSVAQQGRAIGVNLLGVKPSGNADFTPWADGTSKIFPFAACTNGDDSKAPDPLCLITTLTKAIFYAEDATEPAIYVIPPYSTTSKVGCLGIPFDFAANQIGNGWTCVAVSARDQAMNAGISPPIRLWVDKSASLSQKGTAPPTTAGPPPDCTGTWNATTGKADTTKPCTFRKSPQVFPQVFSATKLIVE